MTRQINLSTSSLSLVGPSNLIHHEAVRMATSKATSVLCKEMLRPVQGANLGARESDEVEHCMRLPRMLLERKTEDACTMLHCKSSPDPLSRGLGPSTSRVASHRNNTRNGMSGTYMPRRGIPKMAAVEIIATCNYQCPFCSRALSLASLQTRLIRHRSPSRRLS